MFTVTFSYDACDREFSMRFATSDFDREYVERYAGLVDGTSPHYVTNPREDPTAKIGHCECGGLLASDITEDADPVAGS